MTTLHMKTEEVRNVAHKIDLAVGELYFKPGHIKSAAGSLRSAWQGGRSAQYANQLQQMGTLMQREVIDLQRLVKRLYAEVDQWEDADRNSDFDVALPSVVILFGNGSESTSDGNYPVGWLDKYREQLKAIYGDDAELAWDAAGLIGVFVPTWAGGVIQIIADVGGGVTDFMGWAIEDWEQYDSLGEELAATLFDFYFAAIKTRTLVALDAVEIVIDTLDLIPGGYLVTTAVGLAFWTLGQAVSNMVDMKYEAMENLGAKDAFVDIVGDLLNDAITVTDSSFDPYINQILTDAPSGYSGSW